MRILFLGDVIGKPGVNAVCRHAPVLRHSLRLDLIVCNAENAADGSGLTVRQFKQLTEQAGIDAFTMGDHIYRKSELYPILQSDRRIVRPANFPAQSPGKTWSTVTAANGVQVAFLSLLGRVFMRPVDCPFAAADQVLKEIPDDVKVRLVDVHAEATSDKQLLAHHLDGRVSCVLGTHTHVPTADARLLPRGTAYITDVGMTGPYNSIIGRSIEAVMEATITFKPHHYHVALEDVRLCGALIEVDPTSGRARAIERFELADRPKGS